MTIFEGSCVALVTPFKNEKVDFDALGRLIDFQINAKTDAILVLGTTGESACVTGYERKKIIEFARQRTVGKTKLIVGTGANNTQTAIKYSRQAQEFGADAVLVVTPYYNKCTQNGAILHYTKIAEEINIPIIVYNVPSRTGFNLLPETVKALSYIENIVAIKEANGDINHILELFKTCCGKIDIYCGNDNLNYIFKKLGAKGTISVVANVLPKQIKSQWRKLSGVNEIKLSDRLYELCQMCFIETNPIPIKFLLCKMGLIQNQLRLPLTPLSYSKQSAIWECYKKTKGAR